MADIATFGIQSIAESKTRTRSQYPDKARPKTFAATKAASSVTPDSDATEEDEKHQLDETA